MYSPLQQHNPKRLSAGKHLQIDITPGKPPLSNRPMIMPPGSYHTNNNDYLPMMSPSNASL
jgi:hypothetical protein